MSKIKIHIVIPIYNEVQNLPTLLGGLRKLKESLVDKFLVSIIIVDDGSTDDFMREVDAHSDLSIEVISHSKNMGPGVSFQSAFNYLHGKVHDADWVLAMEGDNTSRLDTILQMLQRAEENYDVILASPYMYGGGLKNTTSFRVILSHIANVFIKELLGIHGIFTMSSFFRLVRGKEFNRFQAIYGAKILEKSGFESMIEYLLKMINLNASISEVPMILDTAKRKGKSKMKVMKTIIGYILLWREKSKWKNQATAK